MKTSNNSSPDNQKENLLNKDTSIGALNQITTRDLILFKEEFLQLLKQFKLEVNIKINSQFENCTKILEDSNNKLSNFEKENKAFVSKLNFIEEKYEIFSKINEVTTDIKNKLQTQNIQLTQCKNDISNMLFKYDKIVSSNLMVPGIIGQNCKFDNMKLYVLNNNEEISNIKSDIDKLNTDLKIQTSKYEDLRDKIEKLPKNFENISQLYTNLQCDKINQQIETDLNLVNDRIQSSKMENSKYVENLLNQEKILIEKNQQINEIKNQILDDNKKTIDKTEKSNKHLNQKFDNALNEFHFLKKKILDLSQLLIRQKSAYGSKETDENRREIINSFNKMLLGLIKDIVDEKKIKKRLSFNKDALSAIKYNTNYQIDNNNYNNTRKLSYNKKIVDKNLKIEITANDNNISENRKTMENIAKRNSNKINKYKILTKNLNNIDNKNLIELNSENVYDNGGSSKECSENNERNNITEVVKKKYNNNDEVKKNKVINNIEMKEKTTHIKIDGNKKNKDMQDIIKNKNNDIKRNIKKDNSPPYIFKNDRNENFLVSSATNTNPNINISSSYFQFKKSFQTNYQDIPKTSNNFLKPKPKFDKATMKKFIIDNDKKELLKNQSSKVFQKKIQKEQLKVVPYRQESNFDNEYHYNCKTESSKRPYSTSFTRVAKNNENNLSFIKYKKKINDNEIYLNRDVINNMSYYKDQDIIDKPLLSNQVNFELINSTGNLEQKILELEFFTKKKFDELVSEIKNFIPIHFNSYIKDYTFKNKDKFSRH